MKTVSFKPFW